MSECNIVDVFLSLLRCDWECLGEKMWVLRFVEQVIGSSKLVGGVELVNCARKIDGMRCPLSRLPILGDFHQPDKAKCQTVNIQSIESWVKLCEVIKEKQTDHGTGRMIFLESVRSLARGDMKLCQDLFQHLLSAAMWIHSDKPSCALTTNLPGSVHSYADCAPAPHQWGVAQPHRKHHGKRFSPVPPDELKEQLAR